MECTIYTASETGQNEPECNILSSQGPLPPASINSVLQQSFFRLQYIIVIIVMFDDEKESNLLLKYSPIGRTLVRSQSFLATAARFEFRSHTDLDQNKHKSASINIGYVYCLESLCRCICRTKVSTNERRAGKVAQYEYTKRKGVFATKRLVVNEVD